MSLKNGRWEWDEVIMMAKWRKVKREDLSPPYCYPEVPVVIICPECQEIEFTGDIVLYGRLCDKCRSAKQGE